MNFMDISPLLLASHAALGLLGYFTGKAVAERSLLAHRHEKPMPHRRLKNVLESASSRGFAIIVALMVVVIALAVQTHYWQKDIETHDECVDAWGQELIETVRARAAGNAELRQAHAQRDRALDEALLLAVDQMDSGETPRQEAKMERRAQEYVKAVREVRKMERQQVVTREQNPYPELNCKD